MSFKIPTFWIFVEIFAGKSAKHRQFKVSVKVLASGINRYK